jgi:glucose-1-phosphate thymidylyltransferase
VKAVILAAGYATRLAPLTDHCPKALLPLGGMLVIERIIAALEDCAGLDGIVIVTNDFHHDAFRSWVRMAPQRGRIELVNDGTRTNAGRLGATGDLVAAIEATGIDDDFLVVSSDRIPTSGLGVFADAYRDTGEAVNACYDAGNRDAVRGRHGCVEIAADGRLSSFEEKPERPRSSIASIALYRYPRKCIPLAKQFLDAGGDRDAPGHFLKWYLERHPVYGFLLGEPFRDIGTLECYREAERYFDREGRGEGP